MKNLTKLNLAIIFLTLFSINSNLFGTKNKSKKGSPVSSTQTTSSSRSTTTTITPTPAPAHPLVTIPPIIQLTFSPTERQAIIQDINNIVHPKKKPLCWYNPATLARIISIVSLFYSGLNMYGYVREVSHPYFLSHAGYGFATACALDGSISLICKIKDYIKDGKGSIAGPVIRNCPKLLIAAVLFKILGW